MYCDRRGTDKTNPDKKPPRTIEIEFVQGTFVQDFCTRPTTKSGGCPRCVTYFFGGPGMCDKFCLNCSHGFLSEGFCQEDFCLEGFVRSGFCPFPFCQNTSVTTES